MLSFVFNEHANHNVQHLMGYLAKSQARYIPKKTDSGHGFVLGSGGERYQIVSFSKQRHLQQYVERHRVAARVIHAAVPRPFAE